MLTLGIETSCDETSCAVLKDRDRLLSNVISSSLFRHKPFGGVVPEIASRHALEQIDTVFQESLEQAKVRLEDIDLIAVTEGPGLIGSLFVGVCFAKALSYGLGVLLIGVNHLEAHLMANFIGIEEPETYVGLLVSGGHTMLSHHQGGSVSILGTTADDAVGEAFDKVAKILGLSYPGGPIVEKMALEGKAIFRFTRPKQDNIFDFSFSGIKTAVLYEVQKTSETTEAQEDGFQSGTKPPKRLSRSFVSNMACSFQEAAVGWLVEKAIRAAKETGAQYIVAGGGVCANQYLRKQLTEKGQQEKITVLFPELTLSLDNAGMIARRGFELYQAGQKSSLKMTGIPNLKIKAKN